MLWDWCAKRLYKQRKQQEKSDQNRLDKRQQKIDKLLNQTIPQSDGQLPNSTINRVFEKSIVIKQLLNITEMSFVIGVSKRSFQRLLTDTNIPRIHIGKRIVFDKDEVLNYLRQQYTK